MRSKGGREGIWSHSPCLTITTYHIRFCPLGTATSGFGGQANVMMVHYDRPGAVRPGVLYTRYLVNDKWEGEHGIGH